MERSKWVMKKIVILVCMVFWLPVLASCGTTDQVDAGSVYTIYGINKDETKIVSSQYVAKSTQQDDLIDELIEQLMTTPERLEYRAPLGGNNRLVGYSLEEGQLILNFDELYKDQPITTEVLVRAAVVRTLTQIEGVTYVSFQIRSEPLKDTAGNVIGIMSADMFIDKAESESNARERVKLRLYFANEDGDRLVETNRTLEYSTNVSNVSLEKLVVEQIIGGPSKQVEGKVFPTINPDTKIVGVTVKDGTCYVNLNESFLTQIYNVTSEVTIYSITNSLVELPNVNRVQIAINGDSNVMYREHTSLSVTYERNLDIVTTVEK